MKNGNSKYGHGPAKEPERKYVNIKDFNAFGLVSALDRFYWLGTSLVRPKTAIIQNSKCTCFLLAAIL